MIERNTDIKGALRSRQRGFFTMPGGLGAGRPGGNGPSGYAAAMLALNPVMYHRLNDTSGTNFVDSSGNGNTGFAVATVTRNQPPLIGGNTASIVNADAGGLTAIQPFPDGHTGGWTVHVIFKKNAIPVNVGDGVFLGLGRDYHGDGWSVLGNIQPDLAVEVAVVHNEAQITCRSLPAAYTLGSTMHYTAVRNTSNQLILYLNGVAVNTVPAVGTNRTSGIGVLLGTGDVYTTASGFYFSDHAWFDYPLSAAEVATLYAARNT